MGFGSVFSLLALVGFLMLAGGIGLAVLAASQGRSGRRGALLAVIGLVIGILFSVISQGVLLVQPQEVAVVFNTVNGSLDPNPRGPGTQIILPVLQQATIYPTTQQSYTMSGTSAEGQRAGDDAVRARTVDGQEVRMDVTVIYAIDPTQANTIHTRWQTRYTEDFVRPTTRSFVRDVVSQFRADQIYGVERTNMEQGIQDLLATRFQQEGLRLNDFLVRDINFSEAFTNAIEEAQIAQQEAERARLRVQQIQQEAEQARAQAQGQRDATIARAEGTAQSTILQARAQAEALRLVSEQIAANPALIQYQYIQQLGDNVSIALVPSNSPFLFDLASLGVGNPDFVAPAVPDVGDIIAPQADLLPDSTPEAAPGSGS